MSDPTIGQPPRPSGSSVASTIDAKTRAPGLPLIDTFGRVHRSLRVSVTDRCNIRCQYCMPEVAQFLPHSQLLSFEQITDFVAIAASMGIREVRVTGGEPLMRPQLDQLIAKLAQIQSLEDIALTTNGMLLDTQLPALVAAGLRRVNISLDTLNESTFRKLARREGLDRVLAGIDAASRYPHLQVRLNALVMREVNLSEVLELVEFARQRNLTLRFIEFMPLDADRSWSRQQLVSGEELRARLTECYGDLVPITRGDPSQPSIDYSFADGRGSVGFIDSVTQPFCAACDRLRLTADGKLRNCLFGREEWDVRPWLNDQATAMQASSRDGIAALIRDCLAAKRAGHGIDAVSFSPPERAMFQIGG